MSHAWLGALVRHQVYVTTIRSNIDDPPVEEEEEVPVASHEQVLDPHGVKTRVDAEKKPLQKKPLIDFSLPKGVEKKTRKIDMEEIPVEEETMEVELVPTKLRSLK